MPDTNLDNIRHSFAHVLALAILRHYPGVRFGVGPVTDDGFFYDFDFSNTDNSPGEDALKDIEKEMRSIIDKDLAFEHTEVSAQEARKALTDQPYKLELIDNLEQYGTTDFEEIQKLKAESQKLQAGPNITLYTIGEFTDLCRGGHVESTGALPKDAFTLTHTAGAYWRGSEKNPMLTRIYGLAFAEKEALAKHQKMLAEAQKRNHRKIGTALDLFSQHDVSPGSIFWHPKGMVLWRELERLIREKNQAYGYGEISTPVMTKKELFETSGHWEHYRENGFWFDLDEQTYVLKPMNCPAATLIYSHTLRSYRDLPLRLAEPTGKLHRNELRGVLGGLFRLRQFVQDDAHVFCRPDQIADEVTALIRYTQEIYELFDLPITFNFATKPDKAMGDDVLWEKAEEALEDALKKSDLAYAVKEKDGTFYGPKIDIHAQDALGREHQLATIQLDFQMPERFELEYIAEDGSAQRPVMIHRAILGSFERFLGVLIEHFAGAFPAWLSPVQAVILPISNNQLDYAQGIQKALSAAGVRVELPAIDETLGKRIRNAEKQKIPYMLVVGDNEKDAGTVTVRQYGSDEQNEQQSDTFIEQIVKQIEERLL